MKKTVVFIILVLLVIPTATAYSTTEVVELDEKHKPLPDYVMSSSEIVQETYILAAQYPQVLASVPCYCGCYKQAGHVSDLDCFVDQMGPKNEVLEWDPMGYT